MSTATNPQEPAQLSLFDVGTTLTEVNVPEPATEPEVRDIGAALVTLTRYHANRTPGPVEP
jgi:hypothetical protein